MPIDLQTYSEGHFRSKQVIDLLDEYHGNTDDTICIAGHGIMNSRIIALLLGQDPLDSNERFGCSNTGITLIENTAGNKFQVVYENSTEHLENLNYMNNKSVFSILGSRKL